MMSNPSYMKAGALTPSVSGEREEGWYGSASISVIPHSDFIIPSATSRVSPTTPSEGQEADEHEHRAAGLGDDDEDAEALEFAGVPLEAGV